MFTPRFQLNDPNEPSNSLKNLNFIPRFLQDPLFITLNNPTPVEQAVLLNEAGATLHPGAFEMITKALREGKELDRGFLSHVAETGKVIIEEATSLVWNKGTPELSRYVVIKRVEPERSDMDLHDDELSEDYFSGEVLQLTLESTPQGDINATLGWENGDCAESHESLIRRWEKVDAVFRRLKKEPPPLDLLPHAISHSENRGDDEYHMNGVTFVCYPMSPDVILQDLEREENSRRHDTDEDDDRDDENEDEWGLFKSSDNNAESDEEFLSQLHTPSLSEDERDEPEDEADGDLLPLPGQDLTIIDPTAGQLATIANLSSMRVPRRLAQQLLEMTRTKAPLTAEHFEHLEPTIREPLAIHRRVTYLLEGRFSETHRYSIDECTLDKPTMFSINLFRQPALTEDSHDFVKSVLHWEMFSSDADIPNWDRILKAAKERRP